MAAVEIIKYQLRRDTAANWNLANPVLGSGEPGYELDTNLLKLGDGVARWAELPYATMSPAAVQALLDAAGAAAGSAASASQALAGAVAARADAVTALGGAVQARTGAETARDNTYTARDQTLTARDAAVQARTGAETARDAAGTFHSTTVNTGAVDANGKLILTRNDGTTTDAGKVVVPTVLTVGEVITGPSTPGTPGAQGLPGIKGDPGGLTDPLVLAAGVDLNNYLTSGTFRIVSSNATLALNFPKDNMGGHLIVLRGASTVVTQTVIPLSTSGFRGTWQRSLVTTWSPWYFTAAQRVDQTAGRAFYSWDDVNNREQLVYGDTGWRDVSGSVFAVGISGTCLIRRMGQQVQVSASISVPDGTAIGATLLTLPTASGFTFSQYQGEYRYTRPSSSATQVAWRFQSNGALDLSSAWPAGGNSLRVNFSGVTSDTWPTSLPGVGSGTIPNA